jgi:pSer/pThr/pTyr-binding forkhead associated (FHA) protein
MANLRVLLEGKELYNIALAKGREYIVGRSETSDIVLNKTSISRAHMKVFFDGESWHIELISKISHFAPFGEEITNLLLTPGMIFILEGYEFRFVEEKTEIKKDSPTKTVPDESPNDGMLAPDGTDTNLKKPESGDHTALATRVASTCLHATNEETGEEILYTLDGNHWIAGRSSSCQIKMTETKSSRQHFELCRTTGGFEIIDLGSSNGTYLNGKRLTAQARTPVVLGDEIKVGKTTLVVEMRNPKFEEQLAQVSGNLFEQDDEMPMESESSRNFPATIDQQYPPQDSFNAPAVIKYQPVPWQGEVPGLPGGVPDEAAAKKKKFYMIGGGVLALLLVLALTGGEPSDGTATNTSTGPMDTSKPPSLDKLTEEQKKLADKTFKLAKKFYMEQKYQLAKIEFEKLHAIVPFYQDSREVENYNETAIQIEADRVANEVKIEKQKQVAETVKNIVKDCSAKINQSSKIADVQACLQSATEMDPENKDAQALIDKVTAIEDQRNQTQLAKETREQQVKKGLFMFLQAQKLEEKNDRLSAIDMYNKFINSGLPDPTGNKVRARETVVSLQTKIRTEINKNLENATQMKSQEKYREAFELLRQSAKWDPTDSRVLNAMTQIENELKKKMKTLYNDGVLEENIGNLESAKTKWRTITDQDLRDGEYARKARSKLKRYGE